MRKNRNPNQGGQSNPRGNKSEPSSHSTVNYIQHLLEISYPEGLIKLAAAPPAPQAPAVIEMPTLHDSLFSTLPDFLKKILDRSSSKEQRDILLLGALTALSACLSKIHGLYDGMRVYPNLYLFVTGPPCASEGPLSLCTQLVSPIHDALLQQTNVLKQHYVMDMKEYRKAKGNGGVEKPVKPGDKLLLIPASNSSMDLLRQLIKNDGFGLIFETEGDTMGKHTNVLRKSFHHEMITYYRLTRNEYGEIKSPRLSVVLPGTIKQLSKLIPCTEDNLFSRFIFYSMNPRQEWKDAFPPESDSLLDDDFDELGREFRTFYEALNQHPDISFNLTTDQQDQFNFYFSQLQDRYIVLQGMGMVATVRRLGLIAYRMSMIFTALRMLETGNFSQKKECLDVDFKASLSIVRTLVLHASHVYSQLPKK